LSITAASLIAHKHAWARMPVDYFVDNMLRDFSEAGPWESDLPGGGKPIGGATVESADVALQLNLKVFSSRLSEWMARHAGKYVVIANGDLVKICETYEAALTFGYEHYSDEQPYLLQKIAPIPEQRDFHIACRGS
jgi:hypothetical protein